MGRMRMEMKVLSENSGDAGGKCRNRRSTIYDVASEAGVSIATVSRYLNSREDVRGETAVRVAAAMEKLDYIPQGNAGSRARRDMGRIGILTPFFPAPSFVQRLQGLIPVLRGHNYEAVFYTIEGPDQFEDYLRSVPFMRRIDGLVLMSIRLGDEHRRILEASGLEVVVVESDDEHYSRVLADDAGGGAAAGRLFVEKGYLPCVYLADGWKGASYSLRPSEARLRGFAKALKCSGWNLEGSHIVESIPTVEEGRRVFAEYLERCSVPRGVFAMSDVQAIGVLKAARERGIQVPGEMAVLGFDDIEAADWVGLSTITQHLGDSGRVAGELLLDRMSGKSRIVQRVHLQVGLVERDTT